MSFYRPQSMPVQSGPMPFPTGQPVSAVQAMPTTLPAQQQSYIENILRLNLGKMVTLYMTYENNSQWNAKIFKGRLEAAGVDHIIISDPQTGLRHLLLMLNLDYATFEGPLNYAYPYAGNMPGR